MCQTLVSHFKKFYLFWLCWVFIAALGFLWRQ